MSRRPSFDNVRLDIHHRAKMPERSTMVREVGFRGVVLDAGCGLGQFSKLIASMTGEPVVCLDLASEEHVVGSTQLRVTGGIDQLPLRSNSVDGVWCANSLMYLEDPRRGMAELVRVCRPGGKVVVKEEDSSRDLILSWDPILEAAVRQAWHEALSSDEITGDGYMGRRIPSLLGDVGLKSITIRSYAIDRAHPFEEDFQRYVTQAFMTYAEIYRQRLEPQLYSDLRRALDPDNRCNFFRAKGSHVLCIETVVSGQKPSGLAT